jgi:acetylornithine deacetylase/succinyl-diaminopimelate desuccinylase-like protein
MNRYLRSAHPAPAAAGRRLRDDAVRLLGALIRNACVNDGKPTSAGEKRSAEVLARYLKDTRGVLHRFEPAPGRGSVVLHVPGTDPLAPSLMLLGHLDVVPVNAAAWSRDPFLGGLVGDEVWGRGALDMLATTVTMAVAAKAFATDPAPARGSLVLAAVADEETGGQFGAKWLVDNVPELCAVDFAVTEFGGARLPGFDGVVLPVMVGEKGSFWCTLRFRGTAGHASMPFDADNALTKAAEAVSRVADYRPAMARDERWRWCAELLDRPSGVDPVLSRMAHAVTRPTFAPTVLRAGSKTNIVPDEAVLSVDIRALPGQDTDEVRRMLVSALGDLASDIDITFDVTDEATVSPVDTPLWHTLQSASSALVPGAELRPMLAPFGTDAKHLRRLGVTAYGCGLYSERLPLPRFLAMMHGNDERIDVGSVSLLLDLWQTLCHDLLK